MVFTIFLAERFYNILTLFLCYKYLFHYNSVLLTLCFPVLFLFFLQCFLQGILWKEETYIYVHTQEKTRIAGSPLFSRHKFFIFS